jgi:hypothetical protein
VPVIVDGVITAGEIIGGGLVGCILTGYCSTADDPAHPEEEDLLNATCDDVSWAIPELEAVIAERKRQYKDSGGGNIIENPRGLGHKKRIERLENKLRSLKDCPKNCP